ncbi:hypothetical protein [Neisseria sp. Ec49-e6-T10]|uniref:hypothetical protein n=1 Tax=Neisseria sp. Ec49-e6-T10 TaxID=3140744 RepID=UPI003EB6A8AC
MSNTTYFVDKINRFTIGQFHEINKYYISIPVRNMLIDYDEYYEINKDTFDKFLDDPQTALPFVEQCRERKLDDLLILKPGRDRGDPV